MSRCRSCNMPVNWVLTENGKRMPLDVNAYDGEKPGGLFVVRDGVAIAVTPDTFPGEPVFQSHFATCRDADQWRRRD